MGEFSLVSLYDIQRQAGLSEAGFAVKRASLISGSSKAACTRLFRDVRVFPWTLRNSGGDHATYSSANKLFLFL
jgi:hypothetical protein